MGIREGKASEVNHSKDKSQEDRMRQNGKHVYMRGSPGEEREKRA